MCSSRGGATCDECCQGLSARRASFLAVRRPDRTARAALGLRDDCGRFGAGSFAGRGSFAGSSRSVRAGSRGFGSCGFGSCDVRAVASVVVRLGGEHTPCPCVVGSLGEDLGPPGAAGRALSTAREERARAVTARDDLEPGADARSAARWRGAMRKRRAKGESAIRRGGPKGVRAPVRAAALHQPLERDVGRRGAQATTPSPKGVAHPSARFDASSTRDLHKSPRLRPRGPVCAGLRSASLRPRRTRIECRAICLLNDCAVE